MPRGTELSEIEKGKIFAFHESGLTIRQIAEAVQRSSHAVWNVINNKHVSKRTGRPKINSKRTIRALDYEAKKNKGAPSQI